MYITLYYIVTRLPDSLRVVRDHFLSVCPTTLTVDLLEKALLAVEKSIVAVGASRGDPRTPIFEGCVPPPLSCPLLPLLLRPTSLVWSRSVRRLPLVGSVALARARGAGALEELAGAVEAAVEAVEGVGVVVGVMAGVEVSAAAVEAAAAVAVGAEVVEVAEVEEGGGGEGGGGGCGSSQRSGSSGGQRQQQQRSRETLSPQQLREWYSASQRGGVTRPSTYVLRNAATVAGEQCGGAHPTQRCFGRLTDALASPGPALPASPVSRGGSGLPLTLLVSSDRGRAADASLDVWGPARVRGQGHKR
ncbi:unnamed protein product [Closterium sp. NIES-65]|nr:unnamed protein product [Closterium sp. NIES-65]